MDSGHNVFVSSPDAEKNLLLFCVGLEDWEKCAGKSKSALASITKGQKGNMASPLSPVTDGKTVWALFGNGDPAGARFRRQRSSGSGIWVREYGRFLDQLDRRFQPLLFDGRLYIQVV